MRRRDFLKGAAGLAAAGLWPVASRAADAPATGAAHAVYLVPGYTPERAYHKGRPVAEVPALARAVPSDWDGALTLATRIDERDGSVRRGLFPIAGHEITVSPDGATALFNGLNEPHFITFDARTLEPGGMHAHGEGWIGAGHAVHARGGDVVVVAERREWAAWKGRPEDHYGRLTIRDARTLETLEVHGSHGIAPHEIALLADGRHVAVAHYGKCLWPDGTWRNGLLYRAEPCLTVVDLDSGKLVHKVVNEDPRYEVRHLAAHDASRVFAIQARLESFEDAQKEMAAWEDGIYEPDYYSAGVDLGYLPAPLLRYRLEGDEASTAPILADDPLLMRYGQSLVYDATHDEVIATYASRHAVVVFAGADGRVRRVLRTDRMGLRQPRGVVLHPDGEHYAVSGYWDGVYRFRRGSHEPVPARHRHDVLFGHSHLSVTAAA